MIIGGRSTHRGGKWGPSETFINFFREIYFLNYEISSAKNFDRRRSDNNHNCLTTGSGMMKFSWNHIKGRRSIGVAERDFEKYLGISSAKFIF